MTRSRSKRPSLIPRPLLLGHRGARAVKSIPENTVASFNRALADGCDGFEFDVRITADGEAVICHDPKSANVEIARAEGRDLPHLARLEDILKRYQDRAFLDIELKVGGLENIAAELLRAFPPRRGFVVSSFLPEVLQGLQTSGIPLGLICETRVQLGRWTDIPCEYVIPHYRLLDRELVQQLKSAEKKIIVWTVNSPAGIRQFAEWGVDGIVSDDAALLGRTFHKR